MQSCLHNLIKFTTRFLHPINVYKPRKVKNPTPNWVSLTSSFTSSMELTTQLEQVFKFFDGNGDGKVSPAELQQAMVMLGRENSSAEKEAEEIVREIDSDKDGFINLDEFLNAMNSADSQVIDAFRLFDCDNNGLISAEELKRVLVMVGSVNCSLTECKKMIEAIDRDGDGFISFQEFKLMMGVID